METTKRLFFFSIFAVIGLFSSGAVAADPIEDAITELNRLSSDQTAYGLQDPGLSYAMRKAVLMAEMLIDSDGQLDIALCPTLKSAFVPANPLEYEANIGHVLDQLDVSWQPFFDGVVKPADPQSVANLTLRALFALPPSADLTDRHAKVAVLASMFVPYNQGPVGDCFAVADLIRDHGTFYVHAAKDYASVVQKGYLTRTVGSAPDYFFYLPVIADYDCDNGIFLMSDGTIEGTGLPFYHAPGFAAAITVMGGNEDAELISDVLKVLLPSSGSSSVQVPVGKVIDAMAGVIASHQQGLDKGQLSIRGKYAFSSLTNSPILRAVECAFAAMAEDRPQDSTRSNINSCVSQALAREWLVLMFSRHLNQFKSAFIDQFNASYRLIYNPDIPLPEVAADGSSTAGGFQLYKRIAGQPTQIGVRVGTPEEFRSLVLDAINSAEEQVGSTAEAKKIAAHLSDFVAHGAFLKCALWDYDFSNRSESDPVANYQKLNRTPMQSCDGDNPYEVDNVDAQEADNGGIISYSPTDANDLIKWCLDLSKKVQPTWLPMTSPQHAFNFAPNNQDIVQFGAANVSSTQWIRQTVCTPGMSVSTKAMDASAGAALANGMWEAISQVYTNHTEYQKMVDQLSAQSLSVQKFAQGLVDGINHLIKANANQAAEVALIVDSILFQVLPANDLALLEQATIRFAFTNWNDGVKDIYFCAYFNPRTQKVGFGIIEEDKTKLRPMDESEWVNNQTWSVDTLPFSPKRLTMGD